jgi:hypothetical protein
LRPSRSCSHPQLWLRAVLDCDHWQAAGSLGRHSSERLGQRWFFATFCPASSSPLPSPTLWRHPAADRRLPPMPRAGHFSSSSWSD